MCKDCIKIKEKALKGLNKLLPDENMQNATKIVNIKKDNK